MEKYLSILSSELNIRENQIANTLALLNEGATIPFISRYRKEMTGSLDEVQVMQIRDRYKQLVELDSRRKTILETISEQGNLTADLEKKIKNAITIFELEDLYLPFKPKRKTKASIAREKGLEPLAKIIMTQNSQSIASFAAKYISSKLGVENIEDALAGARDIIAEWVSEDNFVRSKIRNLFQRDAEFSSKMIKGKEEEGAKYQIYFNTSEKIAKAPSHRVLAMFRGETEGFLKLSLEPDADIAIELIERQFIRSKTEAGDQIKKAIKDSYKRLIQPSIETEIRQVVKEKADLESIRVFGENLRQLLMAPPLGEKTVLALDPGFRSGCKVVVINPQGKLLHNENIYPHPPQNEYSQAASKIQRLVQQYKVEAIAIGNGTAGRETEAFIRKVKFDRDVLAIVVNESGASVYSASSIARAEFPNYDVTVRGAVSIGRRLMDPLAELVKIDPKSIGVGQYQHDVNQTLLQNQLDEIVVSSVNKVGVEVNTASKELLSHVSGVGSALAKNIVDFRNENGPFATRAKLKKVPRFGEKAFEQAAGFLRIRDAKNPLDKSAVHPESYIVVEKMAVKLKCTVADLIEKEDLRKSINLADFVTDKVGIPTLTDIVNELSKPGRDPRAKFDMFEFDHRVHRMEDLNLGMILPGIVTNITNFGLFVDIGVHQDGFVHISHIANQFISDPNTFVKLNQKVIVKVLSVEIDRKRIGLSMKEASE
ncbi:MAG: Tex family protein [Bacteroidota bacterium]